MKRVHFIWPICFNCLNNLFVLLFLFLQMCAFMTCLTVCCCLVMTGGETQIVNLHYSYLTSLCYSLSACTHTCPNWVFMGMNGVHVYWCKVRHNEQRTESGCMCLQVLNELVSLHDRMYVYVQVCSTHSEQGVWTSEWPVHTPLAIWVQFTRQHTSSNACQHASSNACRPGTWTVARAWERLIYAKGPRFVCAMTQHIAQHSIRYIHTCVVTT